MENFSLNIISQFIFTRKRTEDVCAPLEIEDYIPQPILDVSPPKWHLGHSTWFFEQFVLIPFQPNYKAFNSDFFFYFNSYYQNAGERLPRNLRGAISRPLVKEVLDYRHHVTSAVQNLLQHSFSYEILDTVLLGIHHEMQHQELLVYDIKYIFGSQPAMPTYGSEFELKSEKGSGDFISINAGLYEIGASDNGFAYDNERGLHKYFLNDFGICDRLVTNAEYLEFILDGAYQDFNLWHDEAWYWLQEEKIQHPLYWHERDGIWGYYTLNGFREIEGHLPLQHISFYEASAYAAWKNCRLPTEQEWEVASDSITWGQLWEWTGSAYLPYPGFSKAPGALGEYNGKFMINQQVLRGASVATPLGHSRKTYRNFFAAYCRWQFAGIRLVK